MTIATRNTIALLALGLLAACGGSSSTTGPTHPSFDGTWVVCRNDGGGTTDYRERFTIAGTGLGMTFIEYATTDTTCDGDSPLSSSLSLTVAYGDQVTAGLGAGNVMATRVDIALPSAPPATFYTLAYRDTAASPDTLHLGDDTDPYDGSTPALRPISLQSMARALQTAPVASDLTGVWRDCPAAADGQIVTLDAATGAFDLKTYSPTCAAGTVVDEVAGVYTLDAPVYASLGATTVTAFTVNLAATAPAAVNLYTTVWIDTEATPRRLYHGDDSLHGMDGSSAGLRPRVLSPTAFQKQ